MTRQDIAYEVVKQLSCLKYVPQGFVRDRINTVMSDHHIELSTEEVDQIEERANAALAVIFNAPVVVLLP